MTPALDVLTLGQKEIMRGRSLTQRDKRGDPAYCVDCLADLPRLGWWDHRCEIPEPAPAVEHKTTTSQLSGETGRRDKRNRPIRDRSAIARCSCGWLQCWDNRSLARYAAHRHREQAGAAPQ